ncbi:site-specific DNA methylase [Lactococcus phage 3R07S]|uniref:Site-specific DNA methylase n=1 Tax=Lactococcus phage 3R07S TaxID=1874580 RepID=A0A3G1FFB0_9CAUD|nr:site-specific DNA methylase [Lactococcus phage 3R07S]
MNALKLYVPLIKHVARLQKVNKIKATNKSYHDFSEVSGAILYLDPPYEGSYQGNYINSFDSQEFYDWAFEMAKTNIVIISSYSISDERFEAVCSFDKARSTLQNGTSNNRKIEKLFMVKDS